MMIKMWHHPWCLTASVQDSQVMSSRPGQYIATFSSAATRSRDDLMFASQKKIGRFFGEIHPHKWGHMHFLSGLLNSASWWFQSFFWKCSPKNILGEIIPNITCPVAFGKGFYFEDLVTGSPSSPHIVGFGASCNEPFFESQSHQSKDFEGMEDPGESF